MTIEDLKNWLASERMRLKMAAGEPLFTSDEGPIGISIIEAMIDVIAAQEARLSELESLVATRASQGGLD